MKINLDFTITEIDGTEMFSVDIVEGVRVKTNKVVNAAELVARRLFYSPAKIPLKVGFWAEKLFKKEEIELDPSDLKLLKECIASFQLGAGIEFQILEQLKE